jgi:hypothetical protein
MLSENQEFNKNRNKQYLGEICLSMPMPNEGCGSIGFVTTSKNSQPADFLGFVPTSNIWNILRLANHTRKYAGP